LRERRREGGREGGRREEREAGEFSSNNLSIQKCEMPSNLVSKRHVKSQKKCQKFIKNLPRSDFIAHGICK